MTGTVQLRRIARFLYGDALAEAIRRDGPVPVVSSGGITGSHDTANVKGPAIVVGRKGSYGSVHWLDTDCFVIDTAYAVVAASNKVDQRWLYYLLSSTDLRTISQDVGVPGLSREAVYALPVPRPPGIEEQRRIADFLDAEDARLSLAIQTRASQRRLLVARRQAQFSACVTEEGPRYRHHELLGRIGADWKLGQLRRFLPGINVGVVINPSTYFVESGIPFVHGFNVRDGYIDPDGMKFMSRESGRALKRTQLRKGDVLVVRAGAPGRAAAVGPELDGANCASVLILRRSELLEPDFLAAFFNSASGRGQVTFSQYGAAQEVISASQVSSFQIAIPPLVDQRRRIRRLREEDQMLSRLDQLLDRQIMRLGERRQALITAAVTGQFDVTTARGVDVS